MEAPVRFFSGKTQPGNTAWVEYDPARLHLGIYVDVDISHCGFTSPPVVVTSVHGKGHHWEFTGTAAVYNLTERGFRVYVRFPTWERGQQVGLSPSKANSNYDWHVHWIASGPSRADPQGITPGDEDALQ